MADSVKISGFIVLFAGVGVLLFTFYDAYLLLTGVLNISGSGDLMQLFGVALAPLITSAIRALYLGIMGWIGSILTRRGVQTLTFEREETKEKAKPKAEAAKETKETEEKKETKETKEPEKPVEPQAAETKQ